MEQKPMVAEVHTNFIAWCYDKDGFLKWMDTIKNICTVEGLNGLLDNTFTSAGSFGTAFYVGIKGTGTPASGDTMGTHASWAEVTAQWTTANRPVWTRNGAASNGAMSNSSSKAGFTATAAATAAGAFLCNVSTGTAGKFFGIGDFTGGTKTLASGDSLSVQADPTLTTS